MDSDRDTDPGAEVDLAAEVLGEVAVGAAEAGALAAEARREVGDGVAKLTEEFKKKIEQKIAEIEKISSLEIVPIIVSSSSHYFLARVAVFLFLALAAALILGAVDFSLWIQGVTFLSTCGACFLFCLHPTWFRFFMPHSLMKEQVQEFAARMFLDQEVFNTKDRTGVLILISELEKSVFLLADKGLVKLTTEREWQDLGVQLAADFSKQSSGETFLEALSALAKRVAPHFPPRSGDLNELSDKIVER